MGLGLGLRLAEDGAGAKTEAGQSLAEAGAETEAEDWVDAGAG